MVFESSVFNSSILNKTSSRPIFFVAVVTIALGNSSQSLPQHVFEGLDVSFHISFLRSIGFGKNNFEREATHPQPVDKLQINVLRRNPCIDQNENANQVLSFQEIIPDHLVIFFSFRLACFCISVSRQVYQIPLFINEKMIDCSGFPGFPDVFAKSFRSVKKLISVDLPTFDRPMNAYSGMLGLGHCVGFSLLVINSALLMAAENIVQR